MVVTLTLDYFRLVRYFGGDAAGSFGMLYIPSVMFYLLLGLILGIWRGRGLGKLWEGVEGCALRRGLTKPNLLYIIYIHHKQRVIYMVRTQIYLTAEERAALKSIAQQTGKKQSELIRQAIDSFLARYSPRERAALFKPARGMWRGRTDLPDFRALRRELDRLV